MRKMIKKVTLRSPRRPEGARPLSCTKTRDARRNWSWQPPSNEFRSRALEPRKHPRPALQTRHFDGKR